MTETSSNAVTTTSVSLKKTPKQQKSANDQNKYHSLGFSEESKRYRAAVAAATAPPLTPKQASASRLSHDIGTPTYKSIMASMHNNELHGDVNDSSRLAFEKLIEGDESGTDIKDGNTVDSCQMSRMKKMMENEDETDAADAIVSHLAKSPGRRSLKKNFDSATGYCAQQRPIGTPNPISKFSANYDPHAEITGLSVFNEGSIEPSALTASGLNLLERVLNNSPSSNHKSTTTCKLKIKGTEARSSCATRALTFSTGTGEANASAAKTTKATYTEAKDSILKATTLVRHASTGTSSSVTLADPQTPKRSKHHRRPSTTATGTPQFGFSPGFSSLARSSLLHGKSEFTAPPFSPGPGTIMMQGDGIGMLTHLGPTLGGTNLSVPFSPAPSAVLGIFDDKTDVVNGLFNSNSHMGDDSQICDDSNQLGDLAVGANLNLNDELQNHPNPNQHQHHDQHDHSRNDGMHDSNAGTVASTSLLIAPDEFDAISGLGALSNSPFKASMSNNLIPLVDQDGSGTTGTISSNKKKPKKSFFARVVGDSNEPSPMKKLF